MATTDITDVLIGPGDMGTATVAYIMPKLAAATADGPLVEDVTCPTCGGFRTVQADVEGVAMAVVCPDCDIYGTVRIVVHRADPALAADVLRDFTTDGCTCRMCENGRAAARIIGGER